MQYPLMAEKVKYLKDRPKGVALVEVALLKKWQNF